MAVKLVWMLSTLLYPTCQAGYQTRKSRYTNSLGSLKQGCGSGSGLLGQLDPDPGKYRIWIQILYAQKDPCNLNFLVI